MSRIISGVAVFCLALAAMSASAQNASQIERVRQGKGNCPRCNLFQADFSYLDRPWCDLSGSRLRQSDLSLSTMNHSLFTGADLSVANLFGGRFTHASFKRANLRQANLVGAYLGYADFTSAHLNGANMAGANLVGARISQNQLDSACGDASTILPKGLRISPCQ